MDRAPQKLKGFFVEVPTLAERLVDVTAAASRSEAALRDNQVELELLRNLEKNPPEPPPLPFPLTGNLPARKPSEPTEPCPTVVPFGQWIKAQRMYVVIYPRVHIRERPHLYSKKLGVLSSGSYVFSERETDHWIKLRGRDGWILKAQSKYGQLVRPLKHQSYEDNFVAATTVRLIGGSPAPRSEFHMPKRAGGRKLRDDETAGVRLPKKVIVKEAEDGDEVPRPPPWKWEVLFDEKTRKNYYWNTESNEVTWDSEVVSKLLSASATTLKTKDPEGRGSLAARSSNF